MNLGIDGQELRFMGACFALVCFLTGCSGGQPTEDIEIPADLVAPAIPIITSPLSSNYTDFGSSNTFLITGTVASDVVKVKGPGGTLITPVAGNWSYSAALISNAPILFWFSAQDAAGNLSQPVAQTITWSAGVSMPIGDISPGGRSTHGASLFVLEGSISERAATAVDGATSYSLVSGFNFTLEAVR